MNNLARNNPQLLVVDTAEETSLWAELEEKHGVVISHAQNGQAALARLQANRPDLIILSTRLASSLLPELAARGITIPVVLIGANGDGADLNLNKTDVIARIDRPFNAADWAAIAIRNAWLYEAVEEHRRDLELVNQVSRLVSSTLDVEEIPRLLIQRAAEIFEAECGSMALLDKERGGVRFQLAYDSEGNELKGLKDFILPLGVGVVGLVAQTGEPRIVNNPVEDPHWFPLADELTGFKTKKLLAVPIVAEGEILGVIEMLNKTRGDFDEGDLQLLSLVAASAATAIQNARQYEALKEAHETLQELQAQRIAAERWAVLGKAAGGMAHRINNTTTLIPIATQHLRELLQPVPMEPDLRQEIDANLDRIERNTRYTVEMAMTLIRRFRKDSAAAYDINDLVKRGLALVETPANVKVMLHLDPGLPPIDTSELFVDAVVELITNALRALAGREGLLRLATFKDGPDRVSIQVTDSGPGITEKDLCRIFDIFYTTSPHGLGFGLWWVKTFLEQQHGRITVESRPGEGTTFTISLPRHAPPLHSS